MSLQNKSAPANGKRAVTRKEEAQTRDGGKRQQPSAGQAKAAVVLRPIRGRNTNTINPKASQKTEAKDSAHSEVKKKGVVVSATLLTSTNSPESAEEQPLDSPRKTFTGTPDIKGVEEEGPSTGSGTKDSPEDASEEPVKELREGGKEVTAGQGSLTEATVEKPRTHGAVSIACFKQSYTVFRSKV